MIELAFAAGVLLLCHLGRQSGTDSPPAIHVDRFELNHYSWSNGCQSHQVILWKWSADEQRYEPDRFFFVSADGSQDPYRSDKLWRFRHKDVWGRKPDRVFQADELIVTHTDYDPWRPTTTSSAHHVQPLSPNR